MQYHTAWRSLRWLLLAIILLGAVFGGLLIIVRQNAAQTHSQRSAELATALQAWEHAGLNEYEMVINKDGCIYNIRFRADSSTIRSVPMSCTFPPTNVTRLFTLASHDGLIEELCDARGCPCESVTAVRSQYHPALGYPTHVIVDIDVHPAWWKPDLWRHLYENHSLPQCQIHTTSVIEVPQLTPIRR